MKSLWLIFALLLTSCAPVTRQAIINPNSSEIEKNIQQELALKIQLKNQLRVMAVADRIAIASAPYCEDKVGPSLGVVLASKKSVNSDFTKTAVRLWNIADKPTVIAMTTDYAEESGLMVGDQILSVDEQTVKTESTTLTEYFPKPFVGNEVTNLIVLREGQKLSIPIKPRIACDYPASVVTDDSVNAYADGKAIYITTGMLRFAETDEELATVIGHELAHNQMGHIKKKKGNATLGAIFGAILTVATGVDVTQTFAQIGGGAYSKDFESEADYVGIYNVARAGFDISESPNFWRRMGVEHPAAITHGSTHPSTANRFVGLDNAVKEIGEKTIAGLELVPNLGRTFKTEAIPAQENLLQ